MSEPTKPAPKPPLAASAGSALWAVMKTYGLDSITAHGLPLQSPKEGPHRLIPVFNTREQAVAWDGSDEHVAMLILHTTTQPKRQESK